MIVEMFNWMADPQAWLTLVTLSAIDDTVNHVAVLTAPDTVAELVHMVGERSA